MSRSLKLINILRRIGQIMAMITVAVSVHADEPAASTPVSASTPGADSVNDIPQPPTDSDQELFRLSQLSLEELMSVNVTSVQGTAHEWFRTPAAVYVLTGEDVRRSGHLILPEALRLVPGMFVGQVDSNTWRIGPRGFTGAAITSTKNLVLIDGRVVYDPLFSGTFWEVQDVLMEDLDRIEVVRGPGATLWGANAVNGVINVTTRSARDTQGLYAMTGGGDPNRAFGALRYGGQLNEDTWFRVWSQYDNWASFDTITGADNHDDWSSGRVGFRVDGDGPDQAAWTFDGQYYSSFTYGQSTRVPLPGAHLAFTQVNDDGRFSGGHLQFRAEQELTARSGWSFNAYYDQTSRVQSAGLQVDRHTFNVDLRHYFDWSDGNELMWGAQAIVTHDDVQDGPTISLDPDADTHTVSQMFVQNTTELIDNQLFMMIGSKLGYNNYTGFEVQPSARVWWTPTENQTIWAAVSRAVRTPSRIERDGFFTLAFADTGLLGGGPPSGVFVPLGVAGNDDLKSEELIAYELGHRIRLAESVNLDTALFYHDYDNLISTPGAIGAFNNDGAGQSYGAEAVLSWQPAATWRVEAAYSFVNVDQQGPVLQFEEINTPHHQAQLRSYYNLTKDLELNGVLYYVDRLEQANADRYFRLDLGATWRVTPNFELSAWGTNLLDPSHPEASNVEIPRGFYLQATFRF
ncbi:MAG: TonB-dependent receptor [Phycisphaeraceae bacterium]|nr:TonB-dependent receptor [Phycisphaeraceae bacterium]